MDYTDQVSLKLSMPVEQIPNEQKSSSSLSRVIGAQSPLTITVGLPELEPLTPLSTPSPSIRIDDSMSDVSALSPYTPLMEMSPITDTSQQTPARDCDVHSGLSPSTSGLSLGSVAQSPSGPTSRASYRAKAKGLQFQLPSSSSTSGVPLLSPIDAARYQEVFPLPSPMAQDLRRRIEANKVMEMDIDAPNHDNEYGIGTAERNMTQSQPSCLGLDLGPFASGDGSTSSTDSYITYGHQAHKELETAGVDRESGVEEFRAQIMQATVARPASAELVSSPEKTQGRRLDYTREHEDRVEVPLKKTPKRSIPLPEFHSASPFVALSPTKQASTAYTLTSMALSSPDDVGLRHGNYKNDPRAGSPYSRLFGARQVSPSPKRKPVNYGARADQNAIDFMQCRMQGYLRFPERFAQGYLLEAKFAQKYDLETELGSGGYGFVLGARHRFTGEAVAVKFIVRAQIPAHGLVKDHNHQIVPLEAVVLQLARHNGVVEFRGLYKDDIYFYLVQELHGSPWSKNAKNQHKFEQSMETPAIEAQMRNETPHSKSPPVSPYAPTQSSPLRKLTPSLSMPNVPTLGSPASREFGPRPSLPLLERPSMPRRASYDLFECIEQHERLSEGQAKYIFAQVVETVWYLDSIGISHRDIKDENLVIDKDFKVKFIDFGSAVIRDIRQAPPTYTRFFGTVTFASPEILKNQPYTAPPAEVWTLGILLSFLVTGQSPFPTPDHAKHGVMCEPHGSIVVSPSCRDLIRKCLEPDPVLRPSVHQVREHPWLRGALDRA
ncbi:Serine/threonine-protein kinase [Ceratobasidium sp. AG-Ba]|nr:Serine/threonine-protein kinase [Ceratobasidium sp. AG-Ba]